MYTVAFFVFLLKKTTLQSKINVSQKFKLFLKRSIWSILEKLFFFLSDYLVHNTKTYNVMSLLVYENPILDPFFYLYTFSYTLLLKQEINKTVI